MNKIIKYKMRQSMIKKFFLLSMFIFSCSLANAQSLEDFANSMNKQSPSAWIHGRFRLMGASYASNNYTLKTDVKLSQYFDIDALNEHHKQAKDLFGMMIASLSKNKAFAALFLTIIKNNASFTFSISASPSKTNVKLRYSPQELTDIINKYYSYSSEQIFLRGHTIATSIGCPAYFDANLWMIDCGIKDQKIIYYVSFEASDFDYNSIVFLKDSCEKLFLRSLIAFPSIEQLVSSCLATNHKICWQVKESRTKQVLFTITYGEKELNNLLAIISQTD